MSKWGSENWQSNHLSSEYVMKSQVLHTMWCNISGEAAGEIEIDHSWEFETERVNFARHVAIDPFQLVGMQLNWRTEQWVFHCMIIDFIAAWQFSFVLSSSSEVLTSHLKGVYTFSPWRLGWPQPPSLIIYLLFPLAHSLRQQQNAAGSFRSVESIADNIN